MIFAAAVLAVAAALAAVRWLPVLRADKPEVVTLTAAPFHGAVVDPAVRAPQIELLDHRERPFDLHAETSKGNVVVLFFGYTSCPDVCPTTLAHHKQVKQLMGDLAQRVRFVMVSVDPERDSRQRMAQYVEAFDPDFIGLTGSLEELKPVWDAYNVVPRKEEVPGSALGYAVSHPAFTYVVDLQGNVRLIHFLGMPADAVVEDLTALLNERA